MADIVTDVAIIGGGPGGSTLGALLKKYAPEMSVTIFEREKFPREHVGESQLPPIGAILDEMGCWEQVEAANFPIKIGATYRWGNNDKLWDFNFIPPEDYVGMDRPGKFEGARARLALQVERSVYDEILLNHASNLGCDVHQETRVSKVKRDGDSVAGFELGDGRTVMAKTYIDASGHVGLLRRAMGVEIDSPTKLQNIAIWNYWENAEWAVRFYDTGTRVLVMSLGFGWIWFIPLGPTRTSIGLVCPAEYFKNCGKTTSELYEWALSQEPQISRLIKKATPHEGVQTTKDWSFMADRLVGPNWFLVGESAGFADPILAAGLTLTHTSAREAAYSILELERGELDASWIKGHYEEIQKKRIAQHIRFADYWYSANGVFTDLKEYTTEIARDAGLDLDPDKAFQWLGTGGFTNDELGQVGIGGLTLAGALGVSRRFHGVAPEWNLNRYNVFKVDLRGAEPVFLPFYHDGKITKCKAYRRGTKTLPVVDFFAILLDVIGQVSDIRSILSVLPKKLKEFDPEAGQHTVKKALQTMEVMLNDGWITGKLDPTKHRIKMETPEEGDIIHSNTDLVEFSVSHE